MFDHQNVSTKSNITGQHINSWFGTRHELQFWSSPFALVCSISWKVLKLRNVIQTTKKLSDNYSSVGLATFYVFNYFILTSICVQGRKKVVVQLG
jgi:hypothetical protein